MRQNMSFEVGQQGRSIVTACIADRTMPNQLNWWTATMKAEVASIHDMQQATVSDLCVTRSESNVAHCKLKAMVSEFALTQLPSYPAAGVASERRADLAVFDDARIALRSQALANCNLFEQSEIGQASNELDGNSAAHLDPFMQGMLDTIDTANSQLHTYQNVMNLVVEYYRQFTALVALIQSNVTPAVDDSNTIVMHAGEMIHAIQRLSDELRYDPSFSMSVPVSQIDGWRSELGSLVVISNDGTLRINPVRVDVLSHLVGTLPLGDDPNNVRISVAVYSQWASGFSSEKEGAQSDLQMLIEKYSHRNSDFENLVKIASSSMDALLEADKGYLSI